MKIKIALDLTPLYSEHQFRGIGFYTKRLVEALQVLIKKKHLNLELELVKSIDKLRFLKTDLIHYPYFSPFFFSLPAKPLAPSLVTIHDLIPIKYPQHFPAGLKGKLRWQIQKKRLKKMKAVITDSQVWQQEIANLTGYPDKNIYVVPLAAGEEFELIRNKKTLNSVKEKYQLPEKFILYVGDVNWNKNVGGLIRAFYKLKTQNSKLVLIGKAFLESNLNETKAIVQLIKQYGLINQTRVLGYVPTEDLVAVYNLATVYCQPSFDEGFGLPVLEAMACGCPVVASQSGSLPEVCGDAALMVDPQNSQSISTGLEEVIINEKKQKFLQKKGFEWIKNFSWEKTASQTIEIYQRGYHQENV